MTVTEMGIAEEGAICDNCAGGKVYYIGVDGWHVWICANCGCAIDVVVPERTVVLWSSDELKSVGSEYYDAKPKERTTHESLIVSSGKGMRP